MYRTTDHIQYLIDYYTLDRKCQFISEDQNNYEIEAFIDIYLSCMTKLNTKM